MFKNLRKNHGRSPGSAPGQNRQLKGIGGAEPIFTNGQLIQSIPDAIAKVLETHIGAVNVKHQDIHVSNCPICGTGLNDEKCPTCANCGWSKCNGV